MGRTLSEYINDAILNYKKHLQIQKHSINENRENNIREVIAICENWPDEQVLYNKINAYIKIKLFHKNYWIFSLPLEHSELRLMLESALQSWEKQESKKNANAQLLRQNQVLIDQIQKLTEKINSQEHLIADLLKQVNHLKNRPLEQINVKLNKQIMNLQQAALAKLPAAQVAVAGKQLYLN